MKSQNNSQGTKAPTGTQGGTHDQHVKAGQQSHKNDNTASSNAKTSSSSSKSGTSGAANKSR